MFSMFDWPSTTVFQHGPAGAAFLSLTRWIRFNISSVRNMMLTEKFYQRLDPGIRFAVRVLHANGFETCQSCAASGSFGEGSGKKKGDKHSYSEPAIDMPINSNDYEIFGALSSLAAYGLPVSNIAIVWNVQTNGLINEKIGRITFWCTMGERADEIPMFIYSYQAVEPRPVVRASRLKSLARK
jgi:hypothetical protein